MNQEEKDRYYLKIAKQVAERSPCLSRQIGSVLVKDDSIIGTGYNGPPAGVLHCEWRNDEGEYRTKDYLDWKSKQELPTRKTEIEESLSFKCPRQRMGYKSGEGLGQCPAVHSEVNTVLQAAKNGVNTYGSTLYAHCGIPCRDCTKELINAGVRRVVCIKTTEYNQAMKSQELFRQAGVSLEFVKIEDE